jgi:hypothetical protein
MTTRLPAPDFLQPVRRPGLLSWALCGVGLMVLGLGAWDAYQAWHLLAIARAPGKRESLLLARNSAPATRPPARPDADLATAASAKSDANIQHQLAHPWADVWASSEAAARAGVVLLRFEHGSNGTSTSTLQLQGTAADATTAQRAAQALRNTSLWADVLLSRLERANNVQRFEISATLRPEGAK